MRFKYASAAPSKPAASAISCTTGDLSIAILDGLKSWYRKAKTHGEMGFMEHLIKWIRAVPAIVKRTR